MSPRYRGAAVPASTGHKRQPQASLRFDVLLRPDEEADRSADVPLPVCNAISSRSAVVAAACAYHDRLVNR
jgi:hypothetical protein